MSSTANPLPIFSLTQGSSPLLISIPHLGIRIPDDIAQTMTNTALACDDTDWHLDRLYQFAGELGASVLTPTYSRYVIDLNRSPDGVSLYPGLSTTGLCPIDTFNEEPLYQDGQNPDEAEQERRCTIYWRPYHDALQAEIDRILSENGRVLLWEAHSIRSHVPRFFEGKLPDFNFGSANDLTALTGLIHTLSDNINQHSNYSAVANGRFKGGYITRQYGRPDQGVHAIQLELAQCTYMQESRPYAYDEAKARDVAPHIRQSIEYALTCIKA